MKLRDKRPIGPFRELLFRDKDEDPHVGSLTDEEEEVLDMVSNWREGQDADAERRMVKNYIIAMTDIPESEVDSALDKKGL